MIETTAPLWLFFTLAALCVVLVGIAKAGFGGGVGIIATPLMALVISPLTAAALLLPLLCACDMVSIWHYRRQYDRGILLMLLPGAVLGIGLAAGFLWLFSEEKARAERFMNIVIGLTSLLFVAFQLARERLLHRFEARPPGAGLGHFLGLIAGFTSTLSHAGGPPVTIFLVPQNLDRGIFVGTTVWLFTMLNLIKLVPYAALGMLSFTNLRVSLMLLPLVPVGVLLGIWMNRRMSQVTFNRVVYILLTLVGIQLLTGYDPVKALHHLFRIVN